MQYEYAFRYMENYILMIIYNNAVHNIQDFIQKFKSSLT